MDKIITHNDILEPLIHRLFGKNYLSKEDATECFRDLIDEYPNTSVDISYFVYDTRNKKSYNLDKLSSLSNLSGLCIKKNPFIFVYYEVTVSHNFSVYLKENKSYPSKDVNTKYQKYLRQVRKDIVFPYNDKLSFCAIRLNNTTSQIITDGMMQRVILKSDTITTTNNVK